MRGYRGHVLKRGQRASESTSWWYAAPTAAGEASRSTQTRPRRPMASEAAGSSSSPRRARTKATGSSGATVTPPPDSFQDLRHGGARIDRREDGTGGGHDRVRLRRHADAGQAALQRDDVDVAGGEQFRQAGRVEIAGEADVGETCGGTFERGPRGAVAVDEERRIGDLTGGGEHQVERLRESDVAGVEHDRSLAEPQLGAIRGEPVTRDDRVGVDEVGDDVDALAGRRWQLPADVVGEIIGEHGDRIRAAVAHPFERSRRRDDRAVGDRAGLDRGIREDVLDVEDHPSTSQPAHQPAGQAEGDRRRHRDDGVDTAERPADA